VTLASRTLAGLTAAVMLSACGSDSSVSPTNTPVNFAQVMTEMSLSSVGLASNVAPGSGTAVHLGGGVPSGCIYTATSQSFVCAPVSIHGITITRSYSLLGVSGAPLSAFDAKAVSAVRVQSAVSGTDTGIDGSSTLDGHDDMTLGGLQGSMHTLTGTSTMKSITSSSEISGGQSISITSKTTTNLVIPANATAATYPLSGTITSEITGGARFIPGPPETSIFVMTFNGTSKVKITMTGVGAFSCSTLDLATSNVTPGCG
jgi:hypothetical protein